MFKILQKIVRQHLGIEEIVTTIISKIGDVHEIILVGDYAERIQES